MRIIAIAGGSGSGKTTIADRVAQRLDGALILSLDDFYRLRTPEESREGFDFDHPDAIDFSLLRLSLQRLKGGRPARIPNYDFTTSSRKGGREVAPPETLILEGIHALYDGETRSLTDHGFFIETSPETMLARRIHRDVRERGRTRQSVIEQFNRDVMPAYLSHVYPCRVHAARIFENNHGDDVDRIADALTQHVGEGG